MPENNYGQVPGGQVPRPYDWDGRVAEPERVHISRHPLVRHKLTLLRQAETTTKDFRMLLGELTAFLFYEASRDLPLMQTQIQTPLAEMTSEVLAGKDPVIVPILRAGLGMYDSILDLLPKSDVGFIGMYRDEKSLRAVKYYNKFPPDCAERRIFLVDPMLATGSSVCRAITILREQGCKQRNITFICLVAAPEGLKYLGQEHPEVRVVTAALDDGLNEHGYILPGLGDAGDRIFGTK